MQVISIKVDGIEERVLAEFQGEFLSLDLDLGELDVQGEVINFKCRNMYLKGRFVDINPPFYVFSKEHTDTENVLYVKYVIKRKMLFDQEPNHYYE